MNELLDRAEPYIILGIACLVCWWLFDRRNKNGQP